MFQIHCGKHRIVVSTIVTRLGIFFEIKFNISLEGQINRLFFAIGFEIRLGGGLRIHYLSLNNRDIFNSP